MFSCQIESPEDFVVDTLVDEKTRIENLEDFIYDWARYEQ